MKRESILIFIVALVIRIIFALISYSNEVYLKFADDIAYISYAEDIIDQGIWVTNVEDFRDNRENYVAPGLPWILSLIIMVFGHSWLPVFIVNSFISAIICVFIYQLSYYLFDRHTALISALWSILYISYIRYVPSGGKELWLTFLLLIIVYTLIKSFDQFRIRHVFLIALVYALLIHIDERYFAYFPVFSVGFFFLRYTSLRIRLLFSSVFTLVVIMLMVPWTIRNYKVYDKPVIITQRTSHITDKIFGYKEEFYFETFFLDNKSLTEAQIDSIIAGQKSTFKHSKKIEQVQIDAMKEGNIPHQFSKREKLLSRFLLLWRPVKFSGFYAMEGFSYLELSLRHNLAIGLVYGTLLPFLLIGFPVLFKRNSNAGILLISILIWHTLIHIIFIPYTNARYRIPLTPYIIIAGTAGIVYFYQYFNTKTSLKNRKM